MHYLTLALTLATAASAQSLTSSASASATGTTVPLGGDCVPGTSICAGGANCYATNSMLQPRCGNFQATCTSDAQCAFNTCNGGLCNGFIATTSSSAAASSAASVTAKPSSTTAEGFRPAPPSTVTAAAGSLPLGAECNALAAVSQCVSGVQCWASNAGLIARCGNFNAACSSDAQCAYNTCNNGLCNGFLASSSVRGNATTMTTAATGSSRIATATGTRNATRTATGGASATTSTAVFTGAAAVANVAGGVMAVAFGAFAWVL